MINWMIIEKSYVSIVPIFSIGNMDYPINYFTLKIQPVLNHFDVQLAICTSYTSDLKNPHYLTDLTDLQHQVERFANLYERGCFVD